jgi:hypothetical protein
MRGNRTVNSNQVKRISGILLGLLLTFSIVPTPAQAAPFGFAITSNQPLGNAMPDGVDVVTTNKGVPVTAYSTWSQAGGEVFVNTMTAFGQAMNRKSLFSGPTRITSLKLERFNNGTIGLFFSVLVAEVMDTGETQWSSTVNAFYSVDGLRWSDIRPIAASSVRSCEFYNCGYKVRDVVRDSTGRITLLLTHYEQPQISYMQSVSSTDGIRWSPQNQITEGNLDPYANNYHLATMKDGGVLAVWGEWSAGWKLYSAVLPAESPYEWQHLGEFATSAVFGELDVLQSKEGRVTAYFSDNGETKRVAETSFDQLGSTWSAAKTVYSCVCAFVSGFATFDSTGKLHYVTVERSSDFETVTSKAHSPNGGAPFTVDTATGPDANISPMKPIIEPDGRVTQLWSTSAKPVTVGTLGVSGLLNTATGSLFGGALPAGVDYYVMPNGDIAIAWLGFNKDSFTGVVAQAVLLRKSAPEQVKGTAITGKAISKQKLNASSPEFRTFTPLSGLGYQWYRCPKPVSAGSVVPVTCKVIKGATKSSYTVTTADKKAHLTVAVTVSNSLGSFVSVAKSSSKVLK